MFLKDFKSGFYDAVRHQVRLSYSIARVSSLKDDWIALALQDEKMWKNVLWDDYKSPSVFLDSEFWY